MANPLPVLCPEGVWTQVAVNTNIGVLHQLSFAPERYLQTYRETGDSVPVGNDEGARLFGPGSLKTFIAHTTPIDIYVKAVGANGIIGTAGAFRDLELQLNWPLVSSIFPIKADDYNATFARSTSGTYIDSDGIMQIAAADVAGFESAGILLEPQRTNRCENYNVLGEDQLSAEKITIEADRTFSSDTGFWTKGAGWSIDSGVVIGTSTDSTLKRIGILEKGKRYRFTFTVNALSDDSYTIKFGLSNIGEKTTTGTVSYEAVADGFDLAITPWGGGLNIEIDNASVKESGGTDLTDDSFVSGLGTGAQEYSDALTVFPGMTLAFTAGTASTCTLIEDATELADGTNIDLSEIIESGKVYKLSSPADEGATLTVSAATLASTDPHSAMAYVRGAGKIYITGESATETVISETHYSQVTQTAIPDSTGEDLVFETGAGQDLYIAFAGQLEEGSAATSAIIVQGAETTRTADTGEPKLPVADGINHTQTQGSYLIKGWTPKFDAADIDAEFDILTISTAAHTLFSYDGTNLKASDGVNTATFALAVVAGTTYNLGLIYDTSENLMQLFVDGVAGTPTNYDGAFPIETHFKPLYGAPESSGIKGIIDYRVNKGSAFMISETA